jgi:hypothetical protein
LHVAEIKEISVCNYVMEIHTPVLCANKRKTTKLENESIVCVEEGEGDGNNDLAMNEYMLTKCKGSVSECWNQINNDVRSDEVKSADVDNENMISVKSLKAVAPKKGARDKVWRDVVDELSASHERIKEQIDRLKKYGLDALQFDEELSAEGEEGSSQDIGEEEEQITHN